MKMKLIWHLSLENGIYIIISSHLWTWNNRKPPTQTLRKNNREQCSNTQGCFKHSLPGIGRLAREKGDWRRRKENRNREEKKEERKAKRTCVLYLNFSFHSFQIGISSDKFAIDPKLEGCGCIFSQKLIKIFIFILN